MKVMMFCVFWHKTTSTGIWYREKKIVELTPLIDTNSFKNLNTAQKTQKARPKLAQLQENTTWLIHLVKWPILITIFQVSLK